MNNSCEDKETLNSLLEQYKSEIEDLNKKIEVLESRIESTNLFFKKLTECLREMSETHPKDSCDIYNEHQCANGGEIADSAQDEDSDKKTEEETASREEKPEQSKFTETRYLGAPSGQGFEVMNERGTKSIDTIYILEIDRENRTAKFYPNNDNVMQLIQDRKYYLDPVCDVEGSLDSLVYLNIPKENYGELTLDGDYWSLKKKCKIITNY